MGATRLEIRLTTHKLHDDLQSAYRADHSTNTVSLEIRRDFGEASANKCIAALVLLDLSAAFDH